MGRVPLTTERTGGGWGREPRRPRSRARGAVRGSPGGSVHARKGWGAAVNPGGRAAHSLPGSPVERTAELGAPAPALGPDCACALGGDGGQATHEDGHPSVSAECWGGERTAAGRDGTCWRGAGGRDRLRTCRRGAAEGRAEKVTCDNGLREPKSSVWPQAAAISSERLAVGPRPCASVSWVSQ